MDRRLLVVAAFAAASAFPLLSAAQSAASERYVMAVSGGISLGAYDSGRNWVILQALRKWRADGRSLAAVSGASAGAINALVTAMSYCSRRPVLMPNPTPHGPQTARVPEAVDDNALRNLWLGTTFIDLLPTVDGSEVDRTKYIHEPGLYRHPDGILARHNATGAYIDELRAWFHRTDVFDAGCKVKIAIAVNAVEPRQTSLFGGDTVYNVPAQTMYAMFRLEVEGSNETQTRARFIQELMQPDDLRRDVDFVGGRSYQFDGPQLVLPNPDRRDQLHYDSCNGDGCWTDDAAGRVLAFDQVVSVLNASAAFPLAFGRVTLEHCVPEGEPDGEPTDRCGPRQELLSGAFVDGGFTDNVPIGAALALADDSDENRRLGMFYIDPDIRRKPTNPCARHEESGACLPPAAESPVLDIETQTEFVLGTYRVFRIRDRVQPIRSFCGYEDECRNAIVVTRLRPIVGEMAGAFAAFFDQRFLEHDYILGVYDGLRALAAHERSTVESIIEELEIVDSGSHTLAMVREFDREETDGTSLTVKRPLDAVRQALDDAQAVRIGDGDAKKAPTEPGAYYAQTHFPLFAASLAAHSDDFPVDDFLLSEALAHPDQWYAGIARLASGRLLWLETYAAQQRDTSGAESPDSVRRQGIRKLVAVSDILVREFAPNRGWELLPTVNKRRIGIVPYQMMPYQVSLEARRGMLQAYHMPSYRPAGGDWRLEFPVGFNWQRARGSNLQLVGGVNYLLPPEWLGGLVKPGLTVRGYIDLEHHRGDAFHGAGFFVDLLTKVRVEVLWRKPAHVDEELLISVGLVDFPALFARYPERLLEVDR